MRRSLHFALLAIWSLALVSGCFRSTRADFDLTGTEGTVLFESERDCAATVVEDRYRIFNNVWNKRATTGPYRQKIFVKESQGKPIFGWVWKWWPASGVVTYPEVQVGHSPWVGESRAQFGIPLSRRLKETRRGLRCVDACLGFVRHGL